MGRKVKQIKRENGIFMLKIYYFLFFFAKTVTYIAFQTFKVKQNTIKK